ncbi:hypothetical protein LMG27952_03145 [Paraburkholderia hiiakae]|uniref:Minor tail T domain-containing protein n=2 Tax=Paraburkholderia hiiakae TaxID=1081782 RepID=A0ABM8NPD8_9BURK|nr:hypothetical protein LMG27952_03145 [Paraburkholderia hiiakae]
MREVSSAEFTDWIAYSQIEHFGPQIDDLRAGVIAAAIYNVNRDSKKHPTPFGPSDVIPWLGLDEVKASQPILLDDPVAQSNLLRAALFGDRANG